MVGGSKARDRDEKYDSIQRLLDGVRDLCGPQGTSRELIFNVKDPFPPS